MEIYIDLLFHVNLHPILTQRRRCEPHVCTPSRRWTTGARSLTKTPSPTPPSLKPPASLGIARLSRALTHRQSGQTTMSASATHLKSAWHASHITEAKLPRLMAFQVSSLPRRNSTKGMKKEQRVKRKLVRFMQNDNTLKMNLSDRYLPNRPGLISIKGRFGPPPAVVISVLMPSVELGYSFEAML